jgi:hypothetical protein
MELKKISNEKQRKYPCRGKILNRKSEKESRIEKKS